MRRVPTEPSSKRGIRKGMIAIIQTVRPWCRVLICASTLLWTVGLLGAGNSTNSPARTAISPFGTVEEFPAVEARYVRMTIFESSLGEPALDEFEIFSADNPPRNVALAAGGARSSASSTRGPDFLPGCVHDGRHSGEFAWIPREATNAWLEIELPKVERINRIVWSRDRLGIYSDRTPVDYRIEVATDLPFWRQVASSADHLPLPDLLEIPARDPLTLPKEYVIQKGGEEDAFPHSRVNNIAQTPDGYLWLATDQGLVRFDGNRFTVFNTGNTAKLVDGEMRYVRVDRGGRLVLGTTNPGHPVLVYERGVFAALDLPDPALSFAFEDEDGVPWGLGKEGLFPWRNGRYDRTAGLEEFRDSWPVPLAARTGPDGTVWLSKPGLAGRLAHGKFFPLQGKDGRPLMIGTKDLPAKIVPRPDGGAWILEGGIFLETGYGPNRWRHLSADGVLTESRPFPWPQLNFDYHTPKLDHAGNLWLYVSGLGLAKLSPDGKRYEAYGKNEGLNVNEVLDVFEDLQHNVWVWGSGSGMNRLHKPLFATIDSRYGMRTDNVYSLAPARDRGVWIGTHTSGAYLWRQDRLFAFWNAKPHSWSILEDSSGAIWNGTYGWGLRRFASGEAESIRSPRIEGHNVTTALFEDRAGQVWLGGQHGLSRYDCTTGAVKTFVPPLFDRRKPDWVISIAEDREGAVWLGTRLGFLHRLKDDEFETFPVREGDSTHAVCALHFLRPDELWFARFGSGISRLKNGHLTHYTMADGMPTATINGILDDGRGFLWMTSKQGVYRISKQDFEAFAERKAGVFHWQRFTRKDGLPSDECHGEQNQPTLCQTADGRIWIPTVGGIGVIDPAALADADRPAPAIIQETQVISRGNRVLTLLTDGEFDAAKPASLAIPAGANNVLIRYTGIDLSNPRKVSFKHRLIGSDPDWVDAGNGRMAIYSSLGPGTYRFELVAINGHGTASSPAVLGLRVLPLWWETRTFRGTMIGLLAAVGPAIYFFRVRWLKRRHRLQAAFSRQRIQHEEDERKRIAQQVHDILGHELLLLKNAAAQGEQRFERGSAPASHFGQISAIASRALQESRDIAHRLRPIELDRLGLQQALDALLDATAASSGLRVFREIEDVGLKLPDELQVHLYRIVQEGLNNILRHARATTVMFEFRRDGDRLQLHLGDDGVGFDPAAGGRRGLGVTGMEERIQLVGGEFEITSAPGAGTHLRIRFPVPPG